MTAACPACIAAPMAVELAKLPMQGVILSIPSLKCAACIHTVESTLKNIPDVIDARVNLTLKRVSVSGTVPVETLVLALKDVGFDAYPFEQGTARIAQAKTTKDLMLRLGVAGFAMMNVMLLSVAVWSGATDATRDLFHLISAAIALPATLYSAQPFFLNAASALRVRRLNMDVPISLAILLAAGMSLFESLNGGEHAYFDAALSLTFFLLIGRVLEHQTRAAARSAAKDLNALEERNAMRKTDKGYETVAVANLGVDDIVQVATGMRVPVDGMVIEDNILTDRSFLTGESDPVISGKTQIIKAGEINIGKPFHIKATAVGEDTSLRQMARLVETAENARNTYTSIADKAAKIYAPLVHILAFLAFAGWYAASGDFRYALNIAIAVLIITCPCALGLAVPAVATAAIGRLYSLGFLVKSGTALERLAEVDTVFLDKTGTLTQPGIQIDANILSKKAQKIAKGLSSMSQHPVSLALSEALTDVVAADLTDVHEYPSFGIEAKYKGRSVALGRADWFGEDHAGLALKIGNDMMLIPTFEKLRPDADTIAINLKEQSLRVQIISGDNSKKTQALAQKIGVEHWIANVTPEEKFNIVQAAQSAGDRVAMMGDGINDTIALAAAHASIAPSSALNAARNAADVVILKKSLGDLPLLFKISRLSVQLSRENFALAGLYNLIAVPVALAGYATPMIAAIAMSASSLTVLLNALRVRIAK